MLIDLFFALFRDDRRYVGGILKADPPQRVRYRVGVLFRSQDKDAGLVGIMRDHLDLDVLDLGDNLGKLGDDLGGRLITGELSDKGSGGRRTGKVHRHIQTQPRLDDLELLLILDLFRLVGIDILLTRYDIVCDPKDIRGFVYQLVVLLTGKLFSSLKRTEQPFLTLGITREYLVRFDRVRCHALVLRLISGGIVLEKDTVLDVEVLDLNDPSPLERFQNILAVFEQCVDIDALHFEHSHDAPPYCVMIMSLQSPRHAYSSRVEGCGNLILNVHVIN